METKHLGLEGGGAAIQRLREDAGLTLEELASRIGWNKDRLERCEHNQELLTQAVIDEIAKGLGKNLVLVFMLCLEAQYPKLKDHAPTQKFLQELRAEAEEGRG